MNFSDIPFKGCSQSNYTVGRNGGVPKYVTFHHAVGSMESVDSKVHNPAAQMSAHFTVGERGAWQFVDTDDTAWANTNWNSNLECISIEHEGDWRFGYSNEGCIENSAQLIALLRRTHPSIIGFNRHNQVSLSSTVCPADLPCERIWSRSTEILNPPVVIPPVASPAPSFVDIVITDIQNRKVVTNKDANLWDLNFTTWASAKSLKVIPKGTEIEVSATAKHPLGGIYYLSEYSFSKGVKNGINSADVDEIVVKPIDPPIVVPPPIVPPVEPPKPIDPPTTPPKPEKPNLDEENNTLLKQILAILTELLNKIKGVFK